MQNQSATAKIANIHHFHSVSTCQNRWGKKVTCKVVKLLHPLTSLCPMYIDIVTMCVDIIEL